MKFYRNNTPVLLNLRKRDTATVEQIKQAREYIFAGIYLQKCNYLFLFVNKNGYGTRILFHSVCISPSLFIIHESLCNGT